MTALPPDIAPLAAALAGQYAFLREVGRGGMGVVYLARDLKLERLVAIKTLPAHLAADAGVRERFLREARTAASLSHPSIVPIHRADEMAGTVFFVMGFVDGAPLSQIILERGRLTPRQLLPLLRDVAAALGYAHQFGVVHRDVKAENILVERSSGRAMVTDFGIARLAEAAPLTATGTMLGTVHYMSPEQVSGDVVDGRSDFYSLGVLGFRALSGRFPFEHASASAVLVAHVMQAAPLVESIVSDLPEPVGAVINRLLLKDPARRYQTSDELLTAIEEAMRSLTAVVGPPEELVLSSTEAQALWERAAQLQDLTGQVVPPPHLPARRNTSDVADSGTSGYRLEVARDAAAEVGIAPKYFDRAMSEWRGGSGATPVFRPDVSPKKNAFLGEASSIAFESVVDGEMSERDFDVLVDQIRRALGDAGIVSAVGRSLTWSSSDRQRKISVSVLVRGGKTSIFVSERLRDIAGGIFGGIMGGGGGGMIGPAVAIGMQVFHSGAAAAGMGVGLVGGMYLLARTIYTRLTRSRREVLRTLCERLTDEARSSLEQQRLDAPAQLRSADRLPRRS